VAESVGRCDIRVRSSVRTCGSTQLRNKDKYFRRVRHENLGARPSVLEVEAHRWQCRECQRYFRQRFPGIQPCQRSSEAYQKLVYRQHLDGINRSRLGKREGIGAATVERYFRRRLQRQFRQLQPPECPLVLGIDEHFFTRRKGFATTLCDLRNHRIYDVVLGRSEASLEGYFQRLQGKSKVKVVCMDLSASYRALVRKHFPNAKIVADRFQVIRLINQQFLTCWRDLDPVAIQESRVVVVDAPPPPQSETGTTGQTESLPGQLSSSRAHLPVQAAALLPDDEETQDPKKVQAAG